MKTNNEKIMNDCPYELKYKVIAPILTQTGEPQLNVQEKFGVYSDYNEALDMTFKCLRERCGAVLELLLYGQHAITTEKKEKTIMFRQEIFSVFSCTPSKQQGSVQITNRRF